MIPDSPRSPPRVGDAVLAYTLFRITLGVNIAMHGVVRIARPAAFAESLASVFKDTHLPPGFLSVFGVVLPWAEALVGIAVLLGLLTRCALIAGAILMIMLTFGTTLAQKWDIAGMQLPYAIAYWILLTFSERNVFSLDALIRRWRRVSSQ
jgi:thiosulfate dehydrogenase [quinone] large subunit